MGEHDFTLGIDLACNAAHVATLADATGRLVVVEPPVPRLRPPNSDGCGARSRWELDCSW